jgi:hypothetical protein
MLDTTSTGAVKALEFHQLADMIRADRAAAVTDFTRGADHLRKVGENLKIAKSMAGHGRWGEFLKVCGLNERTARRYMQFADLIAKRSPGTDLDGLSIKEAIKLLSPPKPPKPTTAPKPPAQSAKTVAPAKPNHKVTHTAIIEVWLAAAPADRTKAIDSIGLDAILAALPPAWLPLLAERLAIRTVPVAVDAALIPSDLSIPEFLDRRTVEVTAAADPLDVHPALRGAVSKSRRRPRGLGRAGHPGNKFTTISMEPDSTDASDNPISAQPRGNGSQPH